MFILRHGKIFEFPISMTGGNGAVGDPMLLVAGVIEIVGSILLILGLFTRQAAFILSVEMAYAYFFLHVAGKGNLFSQLQMAVSLHYFTHFSFYILYFLAQVLVL